MMSRRCLRDVSEMSHSRGNGTAKTLVVRGFVSEMSRRCLVDVSLGFADPFSATNYKNCSFVISGKHLKLQWIKGLKRLSFKPFFLSVEILQHAYKITKQNLL